MTKKDQMLDELITTEMAIEKLRAVSDQLRQRLGFSLRTGARKMSKYAVAAVEESEKPKRTTTSYRMTEEHKEAIRRGIRKRWRIVSRKGRVKPAAEKKPSAEGIKNYWYSMTPEQRKAEMARRVAKRRGGVKTLATKRAAA